MCFRDRTYCASPDCNNECGRQMTEEIRQVAAASGMPISYAFFCGEIPEEDKQEHVERILNHAATEQSTD